MTTASKHGHPSKTRLDKTGFKQRKGYGFIVLGGTTYQYTWARTKGAPICIMYDAEGNRFNYDLNLLTGCKTCCRAISEAQQKSATWFGKHKKGPNFGGWGKKAARAVWRIFNDKEHEHIPHPSEPYARHHIPNEASNTHDQHKHQQTPL